MRVSRSATSRRHGEAGFPTPERCASAAVFPPERQSSGSAYPLGRELSRLLAWRLMRSLGEAAGGAPSDLETPRGYGKARSQPVHASISARVRGRWLRCGCASARAPQRWRNDDHQQACHQQAKRKGHHRLDQRPSLLGRHRRLWRLKSLHAKVNNWVGAPHKCRHDLCQ